MAMTATQKIIAAHCGKQSVSPGEVVMVNVDKAMGNDITAPVAVRTVTAKGDKVDNPDNVIFVLDHFVPNKDIKSAEQCKCIRDFAKRQGISHVYDVGQMGIEHALLPEKGLVRPSEIILGADSHTCTYGALGAFSTGVGSTDLAVAIMSGKGWLRVPEAIKINLTGKPGKYVSGKDLILTLIGITGVDGANYKSLEFFGDGIDALSMDDRFTVANMAIECGAKNAFFPVDGKAEKYLHSAGVTDFTVILPDADAEYVRTIDIDLSKLQPTVAFPHLPSNVHTFDEGFDIPVDQVVIGSCTNGRLGDLAVAAEILKGKKAADGVRVIIIPATQKIYLEALKLGYLETFINAGCAVSTPTCGPCLGGHMGILADGERAVTTTNRNFVGRMGHPGSEVYLASPAVAAASAITGRLTDPRTI